MEERSGETDVRNGYFLFQETGFPHLHARIVTVNGVTGGSRLVACRLAQ